MLNYATPEKCALWPDDDDWPTWDPHHAPRPGRKTFADAVWHFLVNKTVVIVGDSVGAQVYLAAVCEAARGGLDPLEAKGNTFDFVTRGDEKAPRVPLPEHLAARMRALRRLVIACASEFPAFPERSRRLSLASAGPAALQQPTNPSNASPLAGRRSRRGSAARRSRRTSSGRRARSSSARGGTGGAATTCSGSCASPTC